MEEALYQVILTGQALGPIPHWQAVRAFAHLFSISHEEALQRFRMAPCVARGQLSLEQALKYQRVMNRQGIACEVRSEEPAAGKVVSLYPRLSQA